MKTKANFDDDIIPVNNRCEYLLLRKILDSDEKMTVYELMKYGRTLDMCAPYGMTYNTISRLTDRWEGLGLIVKRPAFKGSDIKLMDKTQEGMDEGERLRRYFDPGN